MINRTEIGSLASLAANSYESLTQPSRIRYGCVALVLRLGEGSKISRDAMQRNRPHIARCVEARQVSV